MAINPSQECVRRAVFFDKDGTLLEDVPYNVDVRRVRFRDDAMNAMERLQNAGYRLFIVTNQPGIATGRIRPQGLQRLEDYLRQSLAHEGIRLEGFYACPHAPEPSAVCRCRKPKPGLLVRAAAEHDLSLTRSWMVGDILDDVEAGNRAGCRTVLLDVGSETLWKSSPARIPHSVVRSLSEATDVILTNTAAIPREAFS